MPLTQAAAIARTVVGIIGNVVSFFLFLSPLPTFKKIMQWKSTREFSGIPYVVMLFNSLLWTFYGIPMAVHPNALLVATTNSIGATLEIAYIVTFLVFANSKERKTIILLVLMVLTLAALVMVLTISFISTHEKRISIVGALCVAVGVAMYASPLTIMGNVIRTRSVKYMPFTLSFAYFINGLVWSIYACIRLDIFILIGNGAGAILGACQLILYAKYHGGEDLDLSHQERNLGDIKVQKAPKAFVCIRDVETNVKAHLMIKSASNSLHAFEVENS